MNALSKILLIACLTLSSLVYGQEPDFKEFVSTNVVTGESLSILAYQDYEGIVLLFISNNCPYAQYYEERIRSMVDRYSESGIAFILVNSHLENDESPSSMKRMWDQWGINIPYLADKTQELKNMFDVSKSPTSVMLKPLASGFSVYYTGKIDNNPMVESDVKEAYLTDNIRSLLSNKPPAHPNNRTIGCMIR
jgi:hypothetical protein